jgi:hypothetical protein
VIVPTRTSTLLKSSKLICGIKPPSFMMPFPC